MPPPEPADGPVDEAVHGTAPRLGATGPDGFTISVDGADVPVRAGQTLVAALLAAGHRSTRRTRFAGSPRGLFCGIGICFDCLVVCNGEPGVRACLRPAEPGDVVRTGAKEGR